MSARYPTNTPKTLLERMWRGFQASTQEQINAFWREKTAGIIEGGRVKASMLSGTVPSQNSTMLEPVTNGDPDFPEVVFDAGGDVVTAEV